MEDATSDCINSPKHRVVKRPSTLPLRRSVIWPHLINLRTDLTKLGYSSVKEWILASPLHCYIGRNLAFYVDRTDLLKYVHSRKSPFVDRNLTKSIVKKEDRRLVKAIQEAKFWANPFRLATYDTPSSRRDSVEKYQEWCEYTGRKHFAHSLKNRILGCWCKPMLCHGDYLIRLSETTVKTEDHGTN